MQGKVRYSTAKLSALVAVAVAVCSAQIPGFQGFSDASQYAAKVLSLTGRVSVVRDSNPEPWALLVGDQVQAKELIVTGPDGEATFQVSDGSTFVVYPNSRVVFRKNEPNWRDLLDVLMGRVKVHIEHLYGPNPNRVLTPTAVISVRGTTFDISVDEDDEATTVEVEEGVVDVRHAMLGGTKTLTTGETLRVYRDQPIASNRYDKGALAYRVLRMAMNGISTWESKFPRGSAGGIGGGAGSVGGGGAGNTSKGAPPPPPTPPPPPPPPPAAPHFVESGGHMIILTPTAPEHEGRWHKFARVVFTTARNIFLGPPPGQDVLIAIQ